MKKFWLLFLFAPMVSYAMTSDEDFNDTFEVQDETLAVEEETWEEEWISAEYVDDVDAEAMEAMTEEAPEVSPSRKNLVRSQEEDAMAQPVQRKQPLAEKKSSGMPAKTRTKDVRANSDRPRVTHRENNALQQPTRQERSALVDEEGEQPQAKRSTAKSAVPQSSASRVQRRAPAHASSAQGRAKVADHSPQAVQQPQKRSAIAPQTEPSKRPTQKGVQAPKTTPQQQKKKPERVTVFQEHAEKEQKSAPAALQKKEEPSRSTRAQAQMQRVPQKSRALSSQERRHNKSTELAEKPSRQVQRSE